MNTSRSTPEQVLQRIDWHVVRRLDGLLQGDYRSLFYGFGLDLADLREYQPGDDIRYIDWNVTARLNTPYVRQYMEDREITAYFLLDLSPSIDFGTQDALKRDQLRDFVAALARLLTRHGNRVGALLYEGATNRLIPVGSGRVQVLRLLRELEQRPKAKPNGQTDLRAFLSGAAVALRRRSLVFVISDFFSLPGWEQPLGMLSRRHEVLAVRLWDPRESELPDVGPLLMQDAETGEQLYVDTRDRGFQRRFREAVQRRETALQSAFRQAHVDVLSLSTTDDLVKALYRFAAQRKQQARVGKAVAA
jgi:uncharacterized protein (DUF58 family)